MEDKIVQVGVFWAITDKRVFAGQLLLEVHKVYYESEADSNGFINYPYSHLEVWDDEGGYFGEDCYKYPRGRVIYDAKAGKHRIFADKCVSQSVIDDLVERLDIENYDLMWDEHYVCERCQGKNHNAIRVAINKSPI